MQVRAGFLVFVMCMIWGFAQFANAQVGAETSPDQFVKEDQQEVTNNTSSDCADHLDVKTVVVNVDSHDSDDQIFDKISSIQKDVIPSQTPRYIDVDVNPGHYRCRDWNDRYRADV